MVNCFVCGEPVERIRYRYPVLCTARCRARAKRLRDKIRRLRRELAEAEELREDWGLKPVSHF